MQKAGKTNPLIVLDEVDKVQGRGYNGDPSSALLEVLDPEQNNTFMDHYLDLPYDLSDVFFIATANTLDTIPQPLLDRMEVITISGYTDEEKFHIGKEHLASQVLEENGLDRSKVSFTDGAMKGIIEQYTREAGVTRAEETALGCRAHAGSKDRQRRNHIALYSEKEGSGRASGSSCGPS